MRCAIKRLTLLAASLMLLSVPVIAAEGTMDKAIEQEQQGGKDVCLLVASTCPVQEDAVQMRIDRLQNEIGRGAAVYTNDELKTLKRELDEEMKILNDRYIGS